MSQKSTPGNEDVPEPTDTVPGSDRIPEQTEAVEVADEPVSQATVEPISEDGESATDIDTAVDATASESDSTVQLLEKLASAQSRIEELNERYIRAKAEMENIRRRSQNEVISVRKYAIDGFAQELLSVADSLNQATRVDMDKSNAEVVINMKEGLELTLKQFDKVMEKFGVIAVEAAPGVAFNPEIHQAISVVESDEVTPEHILNVMQKGFLLKDRLLRPAMVVIAKSAEK